MKLWLGIDPGATGGLALVGERYVDAAPMPMIGKLVDIAAVIEWVATRVAYLGCHTLQGVAIEKAHPMQKMSAMGAFNFGAGWGQLLGLAQAEEWPHTVVAALTWRKAVLTDLPHDKEGAVLFVVRTYPGVDLRPGKKLKPHDGLAEALCIAHFAMHHSDFKQVV